MTKHMRVFESRAQYDDFVNNDNWLPHAVFIPDVSTDISDIDSSTAGRVYFSRIGDEFMQIANGGTLFITDNEEEHGWIDSSDCLHIESPYVSLDDATGTIVYSKD